MVLLRMIFQYETKCNTSVTKVSISPANMTPVSAGDRQIVSPESGLVFSWTIFSSFKFPLEPLPTPPPPLTPPSSLQL
jgi:hypothetical protein